MSNEESGQSSSGGTEQDKGRKTQVLPLDRALLLGIDGPMAGSRHQVKPGETRVGRSDQPLERNDVILADDLKASKLHFVIEGRGGHYVILDRVSRNRTYVNRHKLAKDEDSPLDFGDEIEAGASTFRFARDGQEDWALPRKAGPFWTRRGPLVLLVFSLLAGVVLAWAAISPARYLALAAQKPGSVRLSEKVSRVAAVSVDSASWQYQYAPAMFWLPESGRCGIAVVAPDSSLCVLDGRRLRELWTYKEEKPEPSRSVAVADVTDDGSHDLVFVTTSGRLVALDGGSGFRIWRGPYLAGQLGSPSVDDIDGDGNKEVVVSDPSGRVFVGKTRPGSVDFDERCWLQDETPASIALGPRRGEDSLDMVAVSTSGNLYRMRPNGAFVREAFPAQRVVQMTGISGVRVLSGPAVWPGQSPSIWTVDRSVGMSLRTSLKDTSGIEVAAAKVVYGALGTVPDAGAPARQTAPVVADFDGDGIPDAAVATLTGSLVGINGSTGELLFQTQGQGRWQYLLAAPALYDFDKDGVADVVFGDDRGGVHVVSGAKGTVLADAPSSGAPIIATPLVGDADGDGLVDVVVQDASGLVRVLSSGSPTPDRHPAWPMADGGAGRLNSTLSTAFATRPRLIGVAATGFALVLLAAVNVLWLAMRASRRRSLERRRAR